MLKQITKLLIFFPLIFSILSCSPESNTESTNESIIEKVSTTFSNQLSPDFLDLILLNFDGSVEKGKYYLTLREVIAPLNAGKWEKTEADTPVLN